MAPVSWKLHSRSAGQMTDSTGKSLIIVGITCGALAVLTLAGIIAYIIVHRRRSQAKLRHRNSVPVASRIRNGYVRTRSQSNTTIGSHSQKTQDDSPKGYFKSWSSRSKHAYLSVPLRGLDDSAPMKKSTRSRLKLDTSVISISPNLDSLSPRRNGDAYTRSSLLMKSATSPPPFAQFPPVGRPIRPRAELRVGDTPVEPNRAQPRGGAMGLAGLGSFIPPPPPSWASFWPTESGWTGPGGEPSIRDEDFGSDSGESWEEKKASLHNEDSDDDRLSDSEAQYAVDHRTQQDRVDPLRLTPMALQKDGHVRASMDEALSPGTPSVSASSPSLRPAPGMESPRLDLGEDFTRTDSLDVDQRSLARATTGKFTIAFGRDSSSNPGSSATNRSNTKASGRSKHSRNASHLTRSSTIRTERTDITDASSPISTVSGQIMAVLTGRISTPLLRSMNSLRRAATEAPNEAAADSPGSAGSGTETPVRRLPPVPGVPPVPPLPKQYTSTPRRLPIPKPSRAASLTMDAGEFGELIPRTTPGRSASTPASPPIRPLPVPPATMPQ